MLAELRISGLGVINDATLELGPGFTAVTVPVAQGGHGAGTETFFRLLIDLGEADSNLPQLLRAHFSHVEELLLGQGDHTQVGQRNILGVAHAPDSTVRYTP